MEKGRSKNAILTISMGFLVLYLAFSWKWAVVVSLVVGISGLLSDFLSEKIEWAWMMLAKVLGYIVPNVLLTLVFFFFLFPIALLSRLFSKDPLMLSKKHDTYFMKADREMDRKSFEKIW